MYITNHLINPTFGTKIIDSHTHIGKHEGINYTREHLEPFLAKLPNDDFVEKMIVSDIDVLNGNIGQKEGNKRLLNALSKSNRYSIIAACNVKESARDMTELINENKGKFVGLKFHPHLQNLPITNKQYIL